MNNDGFSDKLTEFEQQISYNFNDKSLLAEALTHSSFSYEHNLEYNYERLEFLGDAVLELITSEYILNNYPELHEGAMTRIRSYAVNEKYLSKAARIINANKYIRLGKGEESSKGRDNDSILADIFEAVTAAIYIDGGYENAKKFAVRRVCEGIEKAAKGDVLVNEKGKLQEISQRHYGILPDYSVIEESGPDHNKIYKVSVKIGKKLYAEGRGKSKKDAEKDAARNMLSLIEKN